MAKPLKGYKAFRIGPIAVDGGMGTALVALGTTVKGSTKASSSEAKMQDFFIEEVSGTWDSAVTEDPAMSGVIEVYDVHPDTAVKVFGGTSALSGAGADQIATFTPPAVYSPIEVSGEIESKNGAILGVARMQLSPVWNLSFQDGELGKMVINWKALVPTKDTTPLYTLSVPAPVAV